MQRPLTGVRVLDLSQFLAGPYGSMILGDLGAEVLKIEMPGKGDGSREMPPHFVHGQSGYFLSMNRSKKLGLLAYFGLAVRRLSHAGVDGSFFPLSQREREKARTAQSHSWGATS